MYCKKCGAELPDNARFCSVCGADQETQEVKYATGNQYTTMSRPSNYLWLAILVTLLCCMPFGIVSIVYAAMVDSKWNAGRLDEARRCSSRAKAWALWGIGLSVLLFLIYVIIWVLILGYGFMDFGDYSFVSAYDNQFV